jgi:uncharacterized membrane protein
MHAVAVEVVDGGISHEETVGIEFAGRGGTGRMSKDPEVLELVNAGGIPPLPRLAPARQSLIDRVVASAPGKCQRRTVGSLVECDVDNLVVALGHSFLATAEPAASSFLATAEPAASSFLATAEPAASSFLATWPSPPLESFLHDETGGPASRPFGGPIGPRFPEFGSSKDGAGGNPNRRGVAGVSPRIEHMFDISSEPRGRQEDSPLTLPPVDLYEALKAIHVLGAMIWVGGGVAGHIIAGRATRSNDTGKIAVAGADAEWIGNRVFTPAAIVLLAVGIWMVVISGWNFSDLWIIFGIAGYTLSAINGMAFLGPASKRVGEMAAASDSVTPDLRAQLDRLTLFSRIDLTILILVVLDMVIKPGV